MTSTNIYYYMDKNGYSHYESVLTENTIYRHKGVVPDDISDDVINLIIENLGIITTQERSRLRVKLFSLCSAMLSFVKMQSAEINASSNKEFQFKIAKTDDEFIAYILTPINKAEKEQIKQDLKDINSLDWKKLKRYIREKPNEKSARLAEVKVNSNTELLFHFEDTKNHYDYLKLISYRS